VSKIASHGPADVEGGSIIAQDAPAQVMDGGRRRDGGSSSTAASSTVQSIGDAAERSSEGELSESCPGGSPVDLILQPLAEALGLLAVFLSKLNGVAELPRRRFSLSASRSERFSCPRGAVYGAAWPSAAPAMSRPALGAAVP
jgi:hypothetical protein